MGRPKKEKPADPILSAALGAGSMPAPMSSAPALGDNALAVAGPLARGIKRLRFLQRQIDLLNAQKSVVIKELALVGFNKKLVKLAEKRTRIDPAARRELEMVEQAYIAAAERALALLDDEPESAESADESEAAE